jgi:thiamine-monophosphate kinase
VGFTVSDTHTPLGEGAEFDAIRHLLKAWGPAAVGIGDDAAILNVPEGERLVVSTDASIENVHFRREWLSPAEIGYRATNAALSDLAAMAARPIGILLSIAIPDEWRGHLVTIGKGVASAADRFGCPIVGGNLSSASALSLTLTVLGSSAKPLERSGVQNGDIIFVTGRLGGPGIALACLEKGQPVPPVARERFAAPRARLSEARWLAQRGAHAAIDISDGLHADAGHLARASRVSLIVNGAAIPCIEGASAVDALRSGEEYELLVAFSPDARPDCNAFELKFGIPLSPVGVAVPEGARAVELTDVEELGVAGFDHLR